MNELGRSNGGTLNDTTFSGSFLDAAFQTMGTTEKESIRESSTCNEEHKFSDSLEETRDETVEQLSQYPLSHHPGEGKLKTDALDENVQRQTSSQPKKSKITKDRRKGPNEILYTADYQSVVQNALAEHNTRYPGKLRDYRRMNDDEKAKAQQHVSDLLARLRIAERRGKDIIEYNEQPFSPVKGLRQGQTASTQFKPLHPPADNSPFQQNQSGAWSSPPHTHDDESTMSDECEKSQSLLSKSEALLSPDTSDPKGMHDENESHAHDISVGVLSQSSSSPIEHARSCRAFQSPDHCNESLAKKRLPSRSGKRGADNRRARLSCELATPGMALEKSLGRMSLSPELHFPASQSPILPGGASPLHAHDGPDSSSIDDISIGDGEENKGQIPLSVRNDKSMQDSLATFDSFALEDYRGRPLKQLIHNVGLKKDGIIHYQPLQTVMRPQKVKDESYPDPLKLYPKPTRSCLNAIYKRAIKLTTREPRSTVIFSLTADQIIHLSLKLLMSDSVASIDPTLSQQLLFGNTLIVTRDKTWIQAFGQALREGSSLSVLDHSSLPLKERKSPSSTERLSRFGAVLTTFEALKSNDTTLALDDSGGILLPDGASQGNWHSSRNGSQAVGIPSLAQCSILHRIHWKRVVMVDAIGRKSYLVKPETSRFVAAKTLKADSRLIYFHDENGQHRDLGIDRLFKSDKKALPAIGSLLQLKESQWNEANIRDLAIDAEDI
ncbi:hypothetical protein ACA910_004060 [Epithemia clementina (nom. ined.)]